MFSAKRVIIKSALCILLFVIMQSGISLDSVYAQRQRPRTKPGIGVDLNTCLSRSIFHPGGFDFDKNGDCWLIDGLDGGQILRFSNNRAVQAVPHITSKNGPLVCVDDNVWFYGGGMLHIMEAKTGKMLKHFDTRFKQVRAGMAYDGKHVWFFANGKITLHDKNDGKVVRTIKGPLTLNHSPLAFDGKNMFIYDRCGERIYKLDSEGSVGKEYAFDYSTNPELKNGEVLGMAWKNGKLYGTYRAGRTIYKLGPLALVEQEKILERVPVRFNGNKPGFITLYDGMRNNSAYYYASTDGVYMLLPGKSLFRFYDTYHVDEKGDEWELRTYLWLREDISKDTGEIKHSVGKNLTGYVRVEKKPSKNGCELRLKFLMKDSVENGIRILATENYTEPEYCPQMVLTDANGKVLYDAILSMG